LNELIDGAFTIFSGSLPVFCVQKRATKQIPGMKNLPYEERLRKLELPTLSYRRLRGDMIEGYKIIQGHYDPEASTIF
jgi:hypothetical protein